MNRITKWITLLIGSTLIAAAALGAVVVVGLTNASAQVETPKISPEIEFSTDDPEFDHGPGGRRPDGRRPGRAPKGNQFLADALEIPLEDLQDAQEAVRIEAIDVALEEGLITEEQAERMKEGRLGRGGGPGLGQPGKPPQDGKIDFDALLADELNISVDELIDAREQARQDGIEQALADGKITEEQLEMMEARKALNEYLDRDAILEKVLGMSREELKEAQAEGKRMPEILEELGLEPGDLRDAMQEAFEDALQEAVDDGVIDEDQAELLKNKDLGVRDHGKPFGPGKRPGPGAPGGFDGSPPMRDQSPSDTDTNA